MKLLVSCLVTVFMFSILVGCGSLGGSKDAIDRVSQEFGVPRKRVSEVVEELGVDPNRIESFGPGFFPYNYYQHRFESFGQEHGRAPTRSEVEQIIVGYTAKCDPGRYGIEYIYYSERTHANWANREIAMVFEVVFQLPSPSEPAPEDPVFSYMRLIDLRDGSINPSWETYWDECIQKYLHER
jgi:hypothetical protein